MLPTGNDQQEQAAGTNDQFAASSSSPDPEEPFQQLFRDLRAGGGGLTTREAQRRLIVHGQNELRHKGGSRWLGELWRQFTHPLALLLWVAASLAALSGTPVLSAVIVAVIVLNALLAFAQEVQANRAIEALARYLPPQAKVLRDGNVQSISAADVVPGDVLVIEEGDRICADMRLIAGSLEVDLSALTGEVLPAFRSSELVDTNRPLVEARELVFSGTSCTGGDARGLVFATGMRTELGRIAALTEHLHQDASPLEKQVRRAAWIIAGVAVAVALAFLPLGTLGAGLPLAAAITFSIGLLVANVPEGLLPTITMSLAVGVRVLARRGALVKRLSALETLGSTTVICTDKTGTLTENRMRVTAMWTDGGPVNLERASMAPEEITVVIRKIAHALASCNNAERRASAGLDDIGDPTETALLAAAESVGADVDTVARHQRRRQQFHFDPTLRVMSTVDADPDGTLTVFCKGAPEEVLARSSIQMGADATVRGLGSPDRVAITAIADGFAREGLRVLGAAFRGLPPEANVPQRREDAEQDLCFLGLVAMLDPPRAEVREAVAACHTAGIRIIVVTGDAGLTAAEVARRVGIAQADPTVVTGSDLDAMSEPDLDRLLREGEELIFARSSPEAKLRIADALRAQGHVVAMTGDGVNDAPALRRADIGIAMGRSGTDVAREAASMVLTDDNFATIVVAIEAGRRVYDNVRKFILYIFVHAIPEMVPFLLFALSGAAIPIPISPLQILSIDLGTDTVPALALGREPAEPGLMDRPPRSRHEGVIRLAMLIRAWLFLGVISAALTMGGFFSVLLRAGWHLGNAVGPGSPLHHAYTQATTVTFLGIVACQIGTAFAARSERASLRSIGLFRNTFLLGGILFEVVVAAILVVVPPFQGIFGNAAPNLDQVAILLPFPFIVWGADELRKVVVRRRQSNAPSAPIHPLGSGVAEEAA